MSNYEGEGVRAIKTSIPHQLPANYLYITKVENIYNINIQGRQI